MARSVSDPDEFSLLPRPPSVTEVVAELVDPGDSEPAPKAFDRIALWAEEVLATDEENRLKGVETALYRRALEGHVQAAIFLLCNGLPRKYKLPKSDVTLHSGDEEVRRRLNEARARLGIAA
jgi:hypothetical protein